MLENYTLENILFLDIETVPESSDYNQLTDQMKLLWKKKAEQLSRLEKMRNEPEKEAAEIYGRAGIYAEFGKIICISTGMVSNGTIRLKTYSGDEEKKILMDFSGMLRVEEKTIRYLCAHNGKEFDYPYLIRRMLINGIIVPPILDLSGKKPWEVNHLDTMDLWKFGDYKNYTSLALLAAVFGIPTPKDDIDGSEVGKVYWEDHDLPRIVKYCQKDVITMVNLFLRFQGRPMINQQEIQFL